MYTESGKLTVTGTAVVRVEPDLASIVVTVTRRAETPAEAYAAAQEASGRIRQFILSTPAVQFQSSRIALQQEFIVPRAGESRIPGYIAAVNFNVMLTDLEAMEPLLLGLVSAGANQLGATELFSSRLKEIRAEARLKALAAAREKAALYCHAAGIELGPIIGLSEGHFDPTQRQSGHVQYNPQVDSEERVGAYSPGSIPIGAMVTVTFKI